MIATRGVYAELETVDGGVALASSYSAALVAALKDRIPSDARRWDGASKRWLIATSHATVVRDICRQYLGVEVTIPTVTKTRPKLETRILPVEYLGATKDRGNGEWTAFGYVGGGWNAVFPEQVLKEWFEGGTGVTERPDVAKTLYQQLGITGGSTESEVRSAYRRLARQWHPDVCKEPDAATIFKQIQRAYEVLIDPALRRKYDAGLALAATVKGPPPSLQPFRAQENGYRSLLRCGYILAEGSEQLGRFVVSHINQWEDITDRHGRVMVTSWPMGAKEFTVEWR
jgi:hypothetical protein